jgi:hypothetical protein
MHCSALDVAPSDLELFKLLAALSVADDIKPPYYPLHLPSYSHLQRLLLPSTPHGAIVQDRGRKRWEFNASARAALACGSPAGMVALLQTYHHILKLRDEIIHGIKRGGLRGLENQEFEVHAAMMKAVVSGMATVPLGELNSLLAQSEVPADWRGVQLRSWLLSAG